MEIIKVAIKPSPSPSPSTSPSLSISPSPLLSPSLSISPPHHHHHMHRFQSSQSLDSTVWRLSIEPTLHTDAGGPLIIIITIIIFIIIKVIIISSFFEGMYECQISTEPKISKLYKLTITGTYSDMIFVQSFTPVDFLAL